MNVSARSRRNCACEITSEGLVAADQSREIEVTSGEFA